MSAGASFPHKGRFISFEGGEGAGKSTQIALLQTFLTEHGMDVVCVREPGGTKGSEQIRTLLKQGDVDLWDGMSELLLFYAARRDLVQKVIKPALARGAWVIADRFADSSLVYQGVARGLGKEVVLNLHTLALGDFWPDVTFFLDVPVAMGLGRVQERLEAEASGASGPLDTPDRFDGLGTDFHEKVRRAYLELIATSSRFHTIDAGLTVPEIHTHIQGHIRSLMDKRGGGQNAL